jgi:hypothetical protein
MGLYALSRSFASPQFVSRYPASARMMGSSRAARLMSTFALPVRRCSSSFRDSLVTNVHSYLRSLLIQAACVLLLWPAKWRQHSFGTWLTAASTRLHHNVLAAALANKLARIAWSVLSQNRVYEPRTAAAAG